MNKKIWLVSLLASLIIMVPMTSAVEINSDVNEESREKFEIEPLDEHIEIISIVCGSGRHTDNGTSGLNIFNGDVLIIARTTDGFYIERTSQVEMKFFIGLRIPGGFDYITVYGFAFGNINW